MKVLEGCRRQQQQQRRCDCRAPTGMSQTEHGAHPPAWRPPSLTSPGRHHEALAAPEPTTGAFPGQAAWGVVVLGGGPFKPCVSMLGWTGQTHQEMLMDESARSQIHARTCHSLKQQSSSFFYSKIYFSSFILASQWDYFQDLFRFPHSILLSFGDQQLIKRKLWLKMTEMSEIYLKVFKAFQGFGINLCVI